MRTVTKIKIKQEDRFFFLAWSNHTSCHKKKTRGEDETKVPPGCREPWYTWQLNGSVATHRSWWHDDLVFFATRKYSTCCLHATTLPCAHAYFLHTTNIIFLYFYFLKKTKQTITHIVYNKKTKIKNPKSPWMVVCKILYTGVCK
jgi:hypothetical protein